MTVRTTMPYDAGGAHVQVMRPLSGGAHHITTSGVSNRNSVAFDSNTRVIEILCKEDCYFQTGDNTVTASSSDHFLRADVGRVYSIGGDKQVQHTHIAVIQDTTGSILHVSELE